MPIDGGSKQYLTREREYLLCGTHGALFRKDDGMCVAGPCLNLALELVATIGDKRVVIRGVNADTDAV